MPSDSCLVKGRRPILQRQAQDTKGGVCGGGTVEADGVVESQALRHTIDAPSRSRCTLDTTRTTARRKRESPHMKTIKESTEGTICTESPYPALISKCRYEAEAHTKAEPKQHLRRKKADLPGLTN